EALVGEIHLCGGAVPAVVLLMRSQSRVARCLIIELPHVGVAVVRSGHIRGSEVHAEGRARIERELGRDSVILPTLELDGGVLAADPVPFPFGIVEDAGLEPARLTPRRRG